jgi:signal transduction histidine kinase
MRAWPRSLMGRTVIVLLLGVLVSNFIGLGVYTSERLDVLTSARGRQIAEQVATASAALNEAPPRERRRLVRAMRQAGLRLFWSARAFSGGDISGWQGRVLREAFLGELGGQGAERLRLALDRDENSLTSADNKPNEAVDPRPRGRWHPPPPGAPDFKVLIGSYRLDDGTWLNFSAPIPAFQPFWATPFFMVIVVTTVLVLAVSVCSVRRATQPLAMFALAAKRLGQDMNAQPLSEEGPREVQQAASAFNRMQERLQDFVRDRTTMLAAMSHDLRTPLTRLRLRAELLDDADQQHKMLIDLNEMQAMIDATLEFARDEVSEERPTKLDLAALLQTVCEEAADTGANVEFSGPTHAAWIGRPTALKRAIGNLVDNAVKYGERARVALSTTDDAAVIIVDDDGPGIPEGESDRVFEPFYRLDASRNRETGGVGLGLAVVRAAMMAHGGQISLANCPDGGLRVTLTLPVAADPSQTSDSMPRR